MKKRLKFHVVPERSGTVEGLDAGSALRSYLGMEVGAEDVLPVDGIATAVADYVSDLLSGRLSEEYGPAEHILLKDLEHRMGDSFPR